MDYNNRNGYNQVPYIEIVLNVFINYWISLTSVLCTSGIDIDGRVEEIERGLNFYERKVSSMVAFGKSIPGFKQLCLEDQATLVKCKCSERCDKDYHLTARITSSVIYRLY